MKELETKMLNEHIVAQSTILELLTVGIYQGQQAAGVFNAVQYMTPIRDSYIDEFLKRDDAESTAPETFTQAKKYLEDKEAKANEQKN